VLTRIKDLFRSLAIYALGDVATSLASFLLLPLYVRFLTPADYGAISLLLAVEVLGKIVFRWGVDASFMRLYYECGDRAARQRLASTLFFFLLALNGVILAAALALAPLAARHLFGTAEYALPLRLVLINTFVGGFFFIPFHVLRIENRAPQFIGLSFGRAAATLAARVLLVVAAGLGVLGFFLADIIVTLAFTLVLSRWFAPLIRPAFSRPLLGAALRFGLPRVPHGMAHQAIAVADRYVLSLFVSLREIGLYSIGATFGMALKLFLSAFEFAWAPFYFAAMKEPDAKRTFSLVTTYGLAILILLAAGLSAIAHDIVRLMTTPEFHEAARVIPWIALGVLFQGVYLLTSIGLNITKRTEYYPVATTIGAATSIGSNFLLIPRLGALGAALSNALAYAVLAGVSMYFSQRVYPVSYEWGRVARLAVAGAGAWAVAALLPDGLRPLPGVLARGLTVVAVYAVGLYVLGFFNSAELRRLDRIARRVRGLPEPALIPESSSMGGQILTATLPEMVDVPEDSRKGRDRP
jgi:O-antigen/teichoic acid export membrane protein